MPYYKSQAKGAPMTKAQENMLQIIESIEMNGKQPKITRMPSTAKRNHKMLLVGRRTTM